MFKYNPSKEHETLMKEEPQFTTGPKFIIGGCDFQSKILLDPCAHFFSVCLLISIPFFGLLATTLIVTKCKAFSKPMHGWNL